MRGDGGGLDCALWLRLAAEAGLAEAGDAASATASGLETAPYRRA